jgi:hypothetical protein
MSKVSMAVAGLLVLGAASPNAAFAAINSSNAAITRGQAIDECRAEVEPSSDNHHTRLARIACVQRLLHTDQSAR